MSAFALAYLWGWVMRPHWGKGPPALVQYFCGLCVWCVVDWISQLVHMVSVIVYMKSRCGGG